MTNELMELENHYFVLSNILLQRIAQKKPQQLEATRDYLIKIEKFAIAEKTLYVAELLKALENKTEKSSLQKLEKALEEEKLSATTISLMMQFARTINRH